VTLSKAKQRYISRCLTKMIDMSGRNLKSHDPFFVELYSNNHTQTVIRCSHLQPLQHGWKKYPAQVARPNQTDSTTKCPTQSRELFSSSEVLVLERALSVQR
jgi:hypothetical protein